MKRHMDDISTKCTLVETHSSEERKERIEAVGQLSSIVSGVL